MPRPEITAAEAKALQLLVDGGELRAGPMVTRTATHVESLRFTASGHEVAADLAHTMTVSGGLLDFESAEHSKDPGGCHYVLTAGSGVG